MWNTEDEIKFIDLLPPWWLISYRDGLLKRENFTGLDRTALLNRIDYRIERANYRATWEKKNDK